MPLSSFHRNFLLTYPGKVTLRAPQFRQIRQRIGHAGIIVSKDLTIEVHHLIDHDDDQSSTATTRADQIAQERPAIRRFICPMVLCPQKSVTVQAHNASCVTDIDGSNTTRAGWEGVGPSVDAVIGSPRDGEGGVPAVENPRSTVIQAQDFGCNPMGERGQRGSITYFERWTLLRDEDRICVRLGFAYRTSTRMDSASL